ncbi:hypothetical protein ACF0H5_018192 [Mactra antiquata]
MVYKTEKHGVRTGNTFKRWNTKYFRKYKSQSYLIRSHVTRQPREDGNDIQDVLQFEKSSGFGEGDSMTDGVEYSLNKQMRWELPKMLENKILKETHEEDYAIELIERHRINQAANCVNVCSTSGVNIYSNGKFDGEKQFNTSHRGNVPCHFQANSVLKNTKPKKRKSRRRRANLVENPDDTNEPAIRNENKIRYEVHYPAPKESFLCHMPERIGINTFKGFAWSGYQDKNQRCRKLANMNEQIQESLAFMEEPLDDSEEESAFHDSDDTFHDVPTQDYHVTLDEILLHANTANRLVSSRNRVHSDTSVSSNENSSTKDHVVFIDREDAQYYDPLETTDVKTVKTERQTIEPAVMEPVRVILADEMVTPQALTNTYGSSYIECECFPRKFIITISERVNKLDVLKTVYASTNVCLVFVHDIDNEINNDIESVYKVMMNANTSENISSVKIETIFDYMETNIEEIIDRSLFFIETLPEDSVVLETESKCYRKQAAPTSLEQCAKWSTSAYLPRNDYLFDYFTSRSMDMKEAVDMGYEMVSRFDTTLEDGTDNIASPKDRFCCICYSILEGGKSGTSLMACCHWFCDSCWTEYLHTKVTEGAQSLVCPEFDCDKTIDAGTVLSLVNMHEILKHAKRCHDTEVEQQATTKWCPNEKCGRVLKINNIHTKNCQCVCGLKMCFDCLDPPHWPASCESVKQYYKKMRDTGDITLEPPCIKPTLTVRGKCCPSCHRFVEKNGGCPFMTCVCRAAFCWGCGQLWNSRTHGAECYKFGYKDWHGTTQRAFHQRDVLDLKKRNKFYKMALIHRVNQHPAKIQILKKASKPLSRKIQGYVFKSNKSGKPVAIQLGKTDKIFYNDYKKALHLVTNTVHLYSEINHVVENTAVLLLSEQLPQGYGMVLKYISNRLSSLAEAIYELFCEHQSFQTSDVFNKLTETRYHAEKTMQSLIRCIKSIQL